MQKSVLLIPINREGKILLQHRSKDAPTYPNQWGFFGGSIKDGETPEEAMMREIKEELGIQLKKIVPVASFVDPEDGVERHIFKTEINLDIATLKSQQKEGDDLKFFSMEKIKQLPIMTTTRLKMLSNLFENPPSLAKRRFSSIITTMPQPEEKPISNAASNSSTSTATMTGPAAVAAALKTELAAIEWPKEGAVVEATLMKKMPRKAYFDMGRFGTGIVFGMEMVNAKEAIRAMSAGDKVSAKIIALDGEEGHIELSLTEAGRQKVWQQAKELAESGEVVKAKIMSANAGGLMAQITGTTGASADGGTASSAGNALTSASGLMAFLPVSQLSLEHYPKVQDGDRVKIAEELRKFVGQELSVKIIDANPRNQKIIVSEREVLATNVKELLGAYTVGQLIDCIVSGVADFGVFVRFVDNPQIEGMIHISELDYKLIENPKDIVKVNDQLQAKIIDIKDGKVFLSLKALKEDPWTGVEAKFKSGDAVEGRVHKFNPFGAVVALDGDLQGMVHISEFGGQDEMKKALEIGKSYPFVIDAVKPEEKRITLKMKK